ncbi:retrovirus-related pol polyprotein from transposon RE2 [Tanacetum coccineum]
MHFINSIYRLVEPHTYFQASKDPKWIKAMAKEIKALEDNKTWILTQLPPGKSAIGHKWVYRIKYLANGSVENYKARVGAKGYNQKEGVDYKETFALVAKMVTVRTLLVVAISKGWFIEQLDINNDFLHGDLHEEVYMTVPQGQWFKKLTSFLLSKDDILITGNDQSFINNLKSQLHDTFSIKDLGPINYYLGIEFLRNSNGLAMSQRKYTLDLLRLANVLDSKPYATPIDPNVKLNHTDGFPLHDPGLYRTLVGKLIYLTITRPDISFAAQTLRQFLKEPRSPHMKALLRVLRYLKLCPDLHIKPSTPVLIFCNNASTIALASNPIHHARTKHIEIDCHFVRNKIKAGDILPFFVPSKAQVADIFTKGLSRFLHYNCLSKLGICNPYSMPTCGGDNKDTHPPAQAQATQSHSI